METDIERAELPNARNADARRSLGPLPARWYVLDKDGIATLCKDQNDADDVAADGFVQWPQRAPYRAVMLGDVAAERERCAKLRALVTPAQALVDAAEQDWPSSPVTRRAVIEAADNLRAALSAAMAKEQANG